MLVLTACLWVSMGAQLEAPIHSSGSSYSPCSSSVHAYPQNDEDTNHRSTHRTLSSKYWGSESGGSWGEVAKKSWYKDQGMKNTAVPNAHKGSPWGIKRGQDSDSTPGALVKELQSRRNSQEGQTLTEFSYSVQSEDARWKEWDRLRYRKDSGEAYQPYQASLIERGHKAYGMPGKLASKDGGKDSPQYRPRKQKRDDATRFLREQHATVKASIELQPDQYLHPLVDLSPTRIRRRSRIFAF
eukprot:g59403.t1